MKARRFHFTSTDGLSIVCAAWEPVGPDRGVVQIAHGMGEHIGRYGELIEQLVGAGFAAYGNDHRGHGRTALPSGNFGDFGRGGFRLLIDDVSRLTAIARNEHRSKPLILLGHSMGSFAAQQLAIDHSELIDGLALSGSGSLDRLVALSKSQKRPPAAIVNAAFEPARTPSDWLSRDPAVVNEFIDDPLCFAWLEPGATESFFAAASTLADPMRLGRIRKNLPLYLFSGSDDPVGQQLDGVKTLIERYRRAGVSNISHDFYPGGRHEMLHEINRGEVQKNLLGWISAVVSARLDGQRCEPETTFKTKLIRPAKKFDMNEPR